MQGIENVPEYHYNVQEFVKYIKNVPKIDYGDSPNMKEGMEHARKSAEHGAVDMNWLGYVVLEKLSTISNKHEQILIIQTMQQKMIENSKKCLEKTIRIGIRKLTEEDKKIRPRNWLYHSMIALIELNTTEQIRLELMLLMFELGTGRNELYYENLFFINMGSIYGDVFEKIEYHYHNINNNISLEMGQLLKNRKLMNIVLQKEEIQYQANLMIICRHFLNI